jgi:PLP dependent protein
MSNIASNLQNIQQRIAAACKTACRSPKEVNLIAASKGASPEMIITVFDLGLKNFGENSVQEAQSKMAELAGIRHQLVWHMIGHLQSNKARQAADMFDMIQSIDSIKLAETLNQRCVRLMPVLIQVNVSGEQTKSGFDPDEVAEAVQHIKDLPNLDIKGLMTIPPPADDPEQIRPIFHRLKELRDAFGLEHLSMGMSDDFETAIEEGATIIRIGRAIFGERRS